MRAPPSTQSGHREDEARRQARAERGHRRLGGTAAVPPARPGPRALNLTKNPPLGHPTPPTASPPLAKRQQPRVLCEHHRKKMLPPTHERTTNARMQPVVNMQGRAPPPQRQQQQQQPYAYQPPPQPAAPPSQQPHQHGGGGGGWDSDWDRQQQQQQQPPHQQQTSGGNFGGGGFGGDGFGGSENFSGSGYSADSISGQMAAPPSKAGGGMPSVSSSGFLLGQGEADELPILEGAPAILPKQKETAPTPTSPTSPHLTPPHPFLADLGINFQHIKEKTKIVLWPKRSMLTSTSEIVQDDDFAGPLLFCLALATLLLFKGKVSDRPILRASISASAAATAAATNSSHLSPPAEPPPARPGEEKKEITSRQPPWLPLA